MACITSCQYEGVAFSMKCASVEQWERANE